MRGSARDGPGHRAPADADRQDNRGAAPAGASTWPGPLLRCRLTMTRGAPNPRRRPERLKQWAQRGRTIWRTWPSTRISA